MPHLIDVAMPPEQYQQARLLCQGERLALYRQELAGIEHVLAQWPRSGTGRYRLVLEVDDQVVEELTCTVTPAKIDEEAYRSLINDLQGERLPTSVAIGLQRTGALAGVELRQRDETTLEQELFRLRRAVTGSDARAGLAPVLRALARDHHRVLTKTEVWVPRERVRRLEPVGLARAIRVPLNLDSDFRPLRVPDVRVEHTVDVYENRLVKLYYEQVVLRLRRLRTVFEADRQLVALGETEVLYRLLAVARRDAAFLDEVALPESLPTRLTMVLMRRPAYRAALEGYLEFHRVAYVELDEPLLDAPLENLPALYEVWGTLQIIDVLLECAEECGYETRHERLARRIGRGLYVRVLPDGVVALVLTRAEGERITLTPQRRFIRTGEPLHSISLPQVPDVVVQVDQPSQPSQLLIFDPKYKLRSENLVGTDEDEEGVTEGMSTGRSGRPKKIDIDRMHAYRDAIRDGVGNRVVKNAAILYPGPTEEYEDYIAALSAVPSQPESLRTRLREVLLDALSQGPIG
jgi:predicted component of viral defense system (DUF524 family)